MKTQTKLKEETKNFEAEQNKSWIKGKERKYGVYGLFSLFLLQQQPTSLATFNK